MTFDAKLATAADLVAEIKKVGFEAVVVDAPAPEAADHAAASLDVAQLPDDLRLLLRQAGEANKTVLLQFTGPD